MTIDLNDLARHLNLPNNEPPTDAGDQAEMQRMLDAAIDHVQKKCGVSATASTTVTVSSSGSPALVLPLTHITAVTQLLDPWGVPVDPYRVDYAAGIVHLVLGRAGVWTVTVSSSTALPAALELAILIIAGHLYGTQRVKGGGQAAPRTPGFQQRSTAGAPPSGSGFAIPNRAAALMAPYELPGIA